MELPRADVKLNKTLGDEYDRYTTTLVLVVIYCVILRRKQ